MHPHGRSQEWERYVSKPTRLSGGKGTSRATPQSPDHNVHAQSDGGALPAAPGVGSRAPGERARSGQWLPFARLACLLRLRRIAGPFLVLLCGHAALAAVAPLRPLVYLRWAPHAKAVLGRRSTSSVARPLFAPPHLHSSPTHMTCGCALPLMVCAAWQREGDRPRASGRPRGQPPRPRFMPRPPLCAPSPPSPPAAAIERRLVGA